MKAINLYKILFAVFILVTFTGITETSAQRKLDLDEIDIKGQFHNDDRLLILGRESYGLKNHVQFRNNYRKEITEELPEPSPYKKR